MHIRELTAADTEAFHALRLRGLAESPRAFGSTYGEEVDQPLEEVAERIAADGVWVLGAFVEDELAGIIGMRRELRPKLRHKVKLFGMYVAPKHRRQGIGRALLDAAVARARATEGVRQVLLAVIDVNAAALRLYEAYGFETWGVEPESLATEGGYDGVAKMILRL